MKQVMLWLEVHTHEADEPQTVAVSMQTTLRWERQFHRSGPVQLKADVISLEYMYELAWLELGAPGEFDEWCQSHDVWYRTTADEGSVDAEDTAETVDPTPAAPSTGSSSSSPARRASRSGSGAKSSSPTSG